MTDRTAAQRIEEQLGPPDRIHRAVSPDGTEIVGRVYGQGPPLVLVNAGLGHGSLDWAFALPYLKDRFTCYCMSTRGRGLSGDHPDQSMERQVQDVVALVESIGEPVGLAGPSGGSMFTLGAAARTDAIAAAAACDPLAFELLGEEDGARLQDEVQRMAGLAEEGRMDEAARDWMAVWANEEEMAALQKSGWLKASAEYVPVLLRLLEAGGENDDYSPTDASVLGQITAPVLVLLGSDAEALWSWFAESARYVTEHVPDATLREIPGAGHCGAWVQPERYAEEMVRFFAEVHTPA